MPSICIRVIGTGTPGPHDRVQVDCSVIVEGYQTTLTHDVYVDFNDTAEEINDKIRSASIARAAVFGFVVGPTDTVRLFGGAHSDET